MRAFATCFIAIIVIINIIYNVLISVAMPGNLKRRYDELQVSN